MALLEATNDWCVDVDNGLFNGVAFVYQKKAFDTINHGILVQKLESYGADTASIPGNTQRNRNVVRR